MAGENRLEEGGQVSSNDSPQGADDSGTTGTTGQDDLNQGGQEGGQQAGGGVDAAASATIDRAEFDKLQTQYKELQSQSTKASQEAARLQEMMKAVEPYIDYSRLPNAGQPAAAQGVEGESGEPEYLTSKQVKDLLSEQAKSFKQELIAQKVRAEYPDVCDNGPKEVIVRWHLENKTSPHEKPEERIKRAVEMTRDIFKSERQQGKTEAEKARETAEAEAKKKAAAAAKASGLGATGPTSPAQGGQENQEMSDSSYVSDRRNRRAQTQTVAP